MKKKSQSISQPPGLCKQSYKTSALYDARGNKFKFEKRKVGLVDENGEGNDPNEGEMTRLMKLSQMRVKFEDIFFIVISDKDGQTFGDQEINEEIASPEEIEQIKKLDALSVDERRKLLKHLLSNAGISALSEYRAPTDRDFSKFAHRYSRLNFSDNTNENKQFSSLFYDIGVAATTGKISDCLKERHPRWGQDDFRQLHEVMVHLIHEDKGNKKE